MLGQKSGWNREKWVSEKKAKGGEKGGGDLLTYSMEQSPSWDANWFCS